MNATQTHISAHGLRISGLEARRGAFALQVETLELAEREYFALIGRSGCGKTTLLRCIAGLCPLEKGQILLHGEPLHMLPPEKRRIGYVPQGGSLFPHMSVKENVAFGLRYVELPRTEKRERIERISELTGIRSLLGRLPATLSGGEARRVALARCLVLRPRLLLLDEPMSMLDAEAQRELAGTLARVHAETDAVTVHVTHDHTEAESLADRVGVMLDGRIIRLGPAAEVMAELKTTLRKEIGE